MTLIININNSQQTGLIAHPGGGQTDAILLDHTYNIVDECATANDSGKLDAGTVGKIREVFNAGTEDLAVFPKLGEEIFEGTTSLGINIPTIIGAGNTVKFRCFTAAQFRCDR